jgi:hypothetical protein
MDTANVTRITEEIVKQLTRDGLGTPGFSQVARDDSEGELRAVAVAEADARQVASAMASFGDDPHSREQASLYLSRASQRQEPRPRADADKWKCAAESFYLVDTIQIRPQAIDQAYPISLGTKREINVPMGAFKEPCLNDSGVPRTFPHETVLSRAREFLAFRAHRLWQACFPLAFFEEAVERGTSQWLTALADGFACARFLSNCRANRQGRNYDCEENSFHGLSPSAEDRDRAKCVLNDTTPGRGSTIGASVPGSCLNGRRCPKPKLGTAM